MADQFEYGQSWAFNVQSEPYLDPGVDYTDSIDFLEFPDFAAGTLRVENQPPLLHGPISTEMDSFSGTDMWMEGQALP